MNLQSFAMRKIPIVEIGTLNKRDRSGLRLKVVVPIGRDNLPKERNLSDGEVKSGSSTMKERVTVDISQSSDELTEQFSAREAGNELSHKVWERYVRIGFSQLRSDVL